MSGRPAEALAKQSAATAPLIIDSHQVARLRVSPNTASPACQRPPAATWTSRARTRHASRCAAFLAPRGRVATHAGRSRDASPESRGRLTAVGAGCALCRALGNSRARGVSSFLHHPPSSEDCLRILDCLCHYRLNTTTMPVPVGGGMSGPSTIDKRASQALQHAKLSTDASQSRWAP